MSIHDRLPDRHGTAMNLTEPIEIGKFFKNRKGDFVVVAIKEFQGITYLDIRQFFTSEDGKSFPTKKGVAIGLRRLEDAPHGADVIAVPGIAVGVSNLSRRAPGDRTKNARRGAAVIGESRPLLRPTRQLVGPWRARRLIFVHRSDKAHCFGDEI